MIVIHMMCDILATTLDMVNIVDDIKKLSASFRSICFKHVSRSSIPTHELAQLEISKVSAL